MAGRRAVALLRPQAVPPAELKRPKARADAAPVARGAARACGGEPRATCGRHEAMRMDAGFVLLEIYRVFLLCSFRSLSLLYIYCFFYLSMGSWSRHKHLDSSELLRP